jgi:hypothetical protein
MATATGSTKTLVPQPHAAPHAAAAPLAPAPVTVEPELSWEHTGHAGDLLGFQIWGVCFLFLVLLHVFDLLGGLLGR